MFDLDVNQYAKIGAELKKTGLESTAVTVCSPEHNNQFSGASVRRRCTCPLEAGHRLLCCSRMKTHLCGPLKLEP